VYRRRDSPPQDGQAAVAVTDAMGIEIVAAPWSAQTNSYWAMSAHLLVSSVTAP